MTERKPFKVDDPYVWLGSQLEHPGESAELTPSADADGDSDTADTGVTNRPSGGAAYLVVMAVIGAIGLVAGVLITMWIAGGGR